MAFRKKHVGKDTSIPLVMGGTRFENQELMGRNDLDLYADSKNSDIVLVGKTRSVDGRTRGVGELIQMAADKAKPKNEGTSISVRIITGVLSTESEGVNTPVVLLRTNLLGKNSGLEDVYCVGFPEKGEKGKVIGKIPGTISSEMEEQGKGIRFSGNAVMAAMVERPKDPHRTPYELVFHYEKPFQEKSFSDIINQIGLFLLEEKHAGVANAAIAVLYLRGASDVILKETSEPEYVGRSGYVRRESGEFFKPSGIKPVPAVVTVSFRTKKLTLDHNTQEIVIAQPVIAMEHKNRVYGGNLRQVISADPGNYGILFLGNVH